MVPEKELRGASWGRVGPRGAAYRLYKDLQEHDAEHCFCFLPFFLSHESENALQFLRLAKTGTDVGVFVKVRRHTVHYQKNKGHLWKPCQLQLFCIGDLVLCSK